MMDGAIGTTSGASEGGRGTDATPVRAPVRAPVRTVVHTLDARLSISEALCEVLVDDGVVGRPRDERGSRAARAPLDLSRTMVLIPGGRLAGALSRRLLARAKADSRPLFAPTIVTPKRFGLNLVEPAQPILGETAALFSWREVLDRSIAAKDGFAEQVSVLFGAPGEPNPRVRTRIARRVGRLSSEVAAAMQSFDAIAESDVVKSRSDLAGRFAVLVEFARRRGELLDSAGVADRDDAMRDAVRAGRVLVDGLDRVVVLFADPDPVQRELLRRLRERGVRVEVCVHRTEDIDDDGFPIVARWEARGFPTARIAAQAIHVAGRPNDAAEAAVEVIRTLGRARGAPIPSDELFVMAPDDEARRALERALAKAAAPAAGNEARPFPATRLGTLLARLAELLGEGSAEALASFVRHDDVARWLSPCAPDAADRVSVYRASTLVGAWRDEPVRSVEGGGTRGEAVAQKYAEVRSAVLELCRPLEGARRAAEWAKPLREVLQAIVGNDASGANADERAATIRALDRELGGLHDMPKEFAAKVGAHEAIELVLTRLSSQEVGGAPVSDGVTIGGWLDAGMADEPHLVLTGFVEGCVPEGALVDPLLPEGVRAALGLQSGSRRAARDAWILDGIVLRTAERGCGAGGGPGAGATGGSAPSSLSFIVPQSSEEGDPLKPSRFLLRVEESALPDRVALLFPQSRGEARPHAGSTGGATPLFERTPRIDGTKIESVSVTAFKTFLQCPYLFQLQHDERLRLRAIDERAVELDARGFGNLVHAALERWGREEIDGARRTEDRAVIEREVGHHLDELVALHYPKSRAPALRVQVELARRRLRRFAEIQAAQAAEGWKLHLVEASFSKSPSGRSVQSPRLPAPDWIFLTGRIDRVDVHEASGRFRALDYKTSAKGESPASVHLRKRKGEDGTTREEWVDLQLPLYRVLLRSLTPCVNVGVGELGYLNLAPTAEKSAISMLDPKRATEERLDEAEEAAERIVRQILAGEFRPSDKIPIRPGDPFAPIWGLGQRGLSDEEGADARSGSRSSGGEE